MFKGSLTTKDVQYNQLAKRLAPLKISQGYPVTASCALGLSISTACLQPLKESSAFFNLLPFSKPWQVYPLLRVLPVPRRRRRRKTSLLSMIPLLRRRRHTSTHSSITILRRRSRTITPNAPLPQSPLSHPTTIHPITKDQRRPPLV